MRRIRAYIMFRDHARWIYVCVLTSEYLLTSKRMTEILKWDKMRRREMINAMVHRVYRGI
jgi:hypothetical protein